MKWGREGLAQALQYGHRRLPYLEELAAKNKQRPPKKNKENIDEATEGNQNQPPGGK